MLICVRVISVVIVGAFNHGKRFLTGRFIRFYCLERIRDGIFMKAAGATKKLCNCFESTAISALERRMKTLE